MYNTKYSQFQNNGESNSKESNMDATGIEMKDDEDEQEEIQAIVCPIQIPKLQSNNPNTSPDAK